VRRSRNYVWKLAWRRPRYAQDRALDATPIRKQLWRGKYSRPRQCPHAASRRPVCRYQSFIWTDVGVFFFDATGADTNSDSSWPDATGADGRRRGNGGEWVTRRWSAPALMWSASVASVLMWSASALMCSSSVMMCLASVMMWSTQLVTSCANIDRRDGGSAGSGGEDCARASAKPDSKKNRDKLVVLIALSVIIIAPPQRAASPGTGAMLWHTPGQTSVYSRMSRGADRRQSYWNGTRRGGSRQTSPSCRSYWKDRRR